MTEALRIVRDYGMTFPVPLLGRLRYGRCESADMLQPKAGRYFQPQAKACRLCKLRRYIL